MKKTILALLIIFPSLIFCQGNFSFKAGTCVLSCILKDTIYIAADTKTIEENNHLVGIAHKLRKTKDIFYAGAGFYLQMYIPTKDTLLYPSRTMEEAINNTSNIYEACKRFDDSITMQMTRFLTRIQNESPYHFKSLLKGFIYSFIMASFVDGKPISLSRNYSLNLIDPLHWFINKDSLEINKQPAFTPLGYFQFVQDYIMSNKTFLKGRNLKKKLIHLINIEAQNDSNTVGMPADIYVIYKGGYKEYTNVEDEL